MKDCANVKRMLSRFLDGETGESEKKFLEAHLSAYPGCAAELAGLSRVKKTVVSRQRKSLPEDYLVDRLRSRLAEESSEREHFSLSMLGNLSRRLIPVPVAAIAFSIALLVLTSGGSQSLEDNILEGGRVSSDTAVALILGQTN